MAEWIGCKRLAEQYSIETVQPLLVESEIGSSRKTIRRSDDVTSEVYTASMRPDDTLSADLTFAIKHEGVHLEFLARLFERVPEQDIADWMNRERTGQYARRIGFLWEWLSGRQLAGVQAVTGGNYVNAIDSEKYLTAFCPRNNQRWRVRDNLPGDRDFCPIVRRTEKVIAAEQYDCTQQLNILQAEYGTDILMRSAVWLTVKESRASFLIEREEDKADRIQRFAAVMERLCGQYQNPLDREALTQLQREVIGEKSTFNHFGLRRSPVFVGETSGFQEVVHYIAPHWDQLDAMLSGMEQFVERTQARASIVRAAVVAFGFVYIHPLSDGNGRIHRFLINDILRRDGAVPKPYILPVSASITHKPQDRARYDTILESFSKPLMSRCNGLYSFDRVPTEYEDQILSNFDFPAYEDTAPAWRYIDLTQHVEYLAELIDNTIRFEMREEAHLLRCWDTARMAIKDVVEGPNQHIDRIIRAIKGNGGHISNKLIGEFPVLADVDVATRVKEAVEKAFEVPVGPLAES
ncbi:Fic family protein [Alcaligenes sp. SDU_A2]|uniref:Fic family protein n=1 Tax=Alcaligenes sp. SDU_A2 TaxID=3136634 RepID=UPI00311DB33C